MVKRGRSVRHIPRALSFTLRKESLAADNDEQQLRFHCSTVISVGGRRIMTLGSAVVSRSSVEPSARSAKFSAVRSASCSSPVAEHVASRPASLGHVERHRRREIVDRFLACRAELAQSDAKRRRTQAPEPRPPPRVTSTITPFAAASQGFGLNPIRTWSRSASDGSYDLLEVAAALRTGLQV